MKIYSPAELNAMTDDERTAVHGSKFGRWFHTSAVEHVAMIFWARDTPNPTGVLNQGSAFMLWRGDQLFLVTAAHVYRSYLCDREKYGDLYCEVKGGAQSYSIRDLCNHLVDCGNLNVPPGEPDPEPDIAVFRLPAEAAQRIGKAPIRGPSGDWPAPPTVGEMVMLVGFPARERKFEDGSFGAYSAFTPVTSMTDRQISCRFDHKHRIDVHGFGLPPRGYATSGMSGGPLLIPGYRNGRWCWRLGGVISQATGERQQSEVIFEAIVSHRAEYILADGRLAKA